MVVRLRPASGDRGHIHHDVDDRDKPGHDDASGLNSAWEDRPGRDGDLQAFLPSISKSRPFFAKLFQRFLWRFCGISMGCKASKPKKSFTKFLTANAAPLAERSCRKTCRFPSVDPTEPARSATASTATLREPAMRRQGSEDRCSVMRSTLSRVVFFRKENRRLIFEVVGLAAIRRRHSRTSWTARRRHANADENRHVVAC